MVVNIGVGRGDAVGGGVGDGTELDAGDSGVSSNEPLFERADNSCRLSRAPWVGLYIVVDHSHHLQNNPKPTPKQKQKKRRAESKRESKRREARAHMNIY